jgi:hypothetical protein
MIEHLMILDSATAPGGVRARLATLGGRILQAYGSLVWLVELPAEGAGALASEPGVRAVFTGPAPVAIAGDDEAARMGIAAWNLRQSPPFRASRRRRAREGQSWGDADVEPEG